MLLAAAVIATLSLAERLGYPKDAKLLIVHADDLGMAHSVNAASTRALENGAINSASIMVPAPWFAEIAQYARKHPQADFGLHLTLTSEWNGYRWGPVVSKQHVPSLLDDSGYFHLTEDAAAARIDPSEAEAEIRAQVERARRSGIQPTHLDSHMRTLHQNAALFEVLLRVARAYKIPAAISKELAARPDLAPLLTADDLIIDRFISIEPDVAAESFYADTLKNLQPGVSELIVHLAYDDSEMRAATDDHPNWGAAWRQRDFDFLSSDAFRRLVRENNIKLITWREVGTLIPKPVAAAVHPEIWPSVKSPLPRDRRIEKQIDDLLRKMTVEEKVGQVIQASITSVTPADVKTYHLGSVLNGGGAWPGNNRHATVNEWLSMADAFYDASMDTSSGKQAIPIIWGSDGVHGHSNVVGATLFPHNIGLGATRDLDLIRQIGEITAMEMAVTGIDWSFSPVVAVARDDRWGRTYESYSEDPEIVRACAAKMIEGLQRRVVATAKHFLGDGGTVGGKDQGDSVVSETQLRDIHGAGYVNAIKAGAQAVMVSQSSWHGREMHGNRELLTDVLKGRMGFDGFVVGDWNGHGQVPGCTNKSCPQAFNAGVDMFMVPDDWKALYESLVAQAKSGEITQSRLDDAVRRILRVKMRAGLFTAGKPSQRPFGGKVAQFGSAEHRRVARQAVRESIVLLKNNGGLLPLRPQRNVLVAGDGADNIGKQSGGWTISWQGDGNSNDDFPGGASIWGGIRAAVEAAGGRATLSADGTFQEKPDVAIVVFGENPYAEWEGDRQTVLYESEKDLTLLRRLKDARVPVVSVFLSGRPLWVNPFLNASDAFVAAWLPGSEGQGIADVLFGAADFRGKLSFSWPKLASQVVLNRGDAGYDPLFPFGFGLTYKDRVELPDLSVDTGGVRAESVYFSAGPKPPWKLHVDEGINQQEEAGGRRVLTWSGGARHEVFLRSDQPADLTRQANMALAIDAMVEKRPTRTVTLSMGCGTVDVTSMLGDLPYGEWRTIYVPLRCFAKAGADMGRIDTPFRLSTDGELQLRFADIELVSAEDATCP
jgi:beta-glucosidase